MDAQQVKEIRKLFNTNQVTAFCGETIYRQGNKSNAHLIWDDELQIMYYLKAGTYDTFRVFGNSPFVIEATSYDMINTCSIPANPAILAGWLTAVKERGLIQDEEMTEVFERLMRTTVEANINGGTAGLNPMVSNYQYSSQHYGNSMPQQPNIDHTSQMTESAE